MSKSGRQVEPGAQQNRIPRWISGAPSAEALTRPPQHSPETLEENRRLLADYRKRCIVTPTPDRDMEYIHERAWSLHAYRAALRNKVGWWAVIAAAKALALAHMPPNYQLDLRAGVGGSLNTFYLLSGESGSGKGVAMSTAAESFVYPDYHPFFAPQYRTPKHASGLAGLFMQQVPKVQQERDVQPSRGRGRISDHEKEWVRRHYSLLMKYTEVSEFKTLIRDDIGVGILCKTFSAEQLGGSAQDIVYSAMVPEGSYRCMTLIGVQPGNAAMFLDHATTGLPQRGIWVPVRPHMSPGELKKLFDGWAAHVVVPMPLRGVPDMYPTTVCLCGEDLTPLPYTRHPKGTNCRWYLETGKIGIVYAAKMESGKRIPVKLAPELRRLLTALDIEQAVAPPGQIDPLDKHKLMLQTADAAGEAYMNNWDGADEVVVTLRDFERAGYMMCVHEATRTEAAVESLNVKSEQMRRMGRDSATLAVEREDTMSRQVLDRCRKKILEVASMDPGAWVQLDRHHLTPKQRQMSGEVLQALVEVEGVLEVRPGTPEQPRTLIRLLPEVVPKDDV